jgi:hypothetical protein
MDYDLILIHPLEAWGLKLGEKGRKLEISNKYEDRFYKLEN